MCQSSNMGRAQSFERVWYLGNLWNIAIHYCRHNILSPGEMQQVAFARLFYHRPPFASKK